MHPGICMIGVLNPRPMMSLTRLASAASSSMNRPQTAQRAGFELADFGGINTTWEGAPRGRCSARGVEAAGISRMVKGRYCRVPARQAVRYG